MIQCIPQKTWPAVPPTPSETLTQPSAELPLLPSAEPPTLSACTTIPQAVAVCGLGGSAQVRAENGLNLGEKWILTNWRRRPAPGRRVFGGDWLARFTERGTRNGNARETHNSAFRLAFRERIPGTPIRNPHPGFFFGFIRPNPNPRSLFSNTSQVAQPGV